MKRLKKMGFLIVASIVVVFFLFQSFVIKSTSETEQQKYVLVRDYKDFEIRFYPAVTLATIHSEATTYRDLSGPGFRKLAGYIFGGNEEQKKIAMTAPVHMNINDSVSTMSFVMPSAYAKANLPKPNDPGVSIRSTEDEYVAVIAFGGYASDKDIKFYSLKLKKLLGERGITPQGNFRFYGYNPPFQLSNRRNEIVVTVDWKE